MFQKKKKEKKIDIQNIDKEFYSLHETMNHHKKCGNNLYLLNNIVKRP